MHPSRFVKLEGGLNKWNLIEEVLPEAYLRMSENRQTCSIDKDYKDIMLSFSKVDKRKMQDNDRISAVMLVQFVHHFLA